MGQILVADDEEVMRELYLGILGDDFPDYEIESFKDGTSLAGRLETDSSNVRIVLTDNSMPGINGAEIITRYARNPRFTGKIPFVLIFGGDERIGKKAVEDGAFSYLLKPFNMSQLTSLVQKALNR